MAAINFPDSPTAGDTFTSNDKTWVYLDGKWTFQTGEVPLSVSITSATSGQFLKWNGSAWVNDAIDLSTDTTGSFVASLVAGTGVTLANNSGEASTPTVTVDTTVIAPLASPTFTGTPTLPTGTIATTQTASDSTTKIATTAFVTTADNLKANLASPTFTGTVTANDVTVSGNLTVSGTTTSINTETLTVNDNIVVLNNNATGAPTENAGLEVERGSSTNVVLRWNETSDKWELTNDGSTYADIATETYAASLTPATLNDIGDVTITSPAAGQTIQWNGSAWINITPTGTTVTTTANRSTDIPSPFIGQLIVLTDTKKVQLWDGTAWLNITMAPPEPPTSLSATALSGTSISIAFTAGGANGSPITNYKYALSTNGGSTYGSFTALSPEDTTTPITISGLTIGAAYYFKLKAVNDLGDSVASVAVSVSTLSTPEAPTSLSATPASTSVAISFTPGSQGGSAITNYQYALSTNSGSTYGSFTALSPADATSPITISGLTASTAYYIKLKGVNSDGVSAESSAVSFSTTAMPALTVNYLVIAGGGGGGSQLGGGGGSGGLRGSFDVTGGGGTLQSALTLTSSTNYSTTIGAGGAGSTSNSALGANGQSSSFDSVSTTGGGGGSSASYNNVPTGPGGGGHGDAAGNNSGSVGTTNQSFGGGAGINGGTYNGGGGGGTGSAGSGASTNNGGNGGNGVQSSITGTAIYYGGGGGGGAGLFAGAGATAGNGGLGGGGAGVNNNGVGVAGTNNLGAGGGGGGQNGSTGTGGNGGTGVVILRYPSEYTITIGAGLTGTTATVSSSKVTTITAGTGNVSWA